MTNRFACMPCSSGKMDHAVKTCRACKHVAWCFHPTPALHNVPTGNRYSDSPIMYQDPPFRPLHPIMTNSNPSKLTQDICSMLLLPVFLPVLQYSSAAKTASPPIDTLSAPDRKYSDATSSADQCLPSASVNSLMPPPTVRGTNTPSLACRTTYTCNSRNSKDLHFLERNAIPPTHAAVKTQRAYNAFKIMPYHQHMHLFRLKASPLP